MRSIFVLLLMLLIAFSSINSKSQDFEELLEWGKSHSVFISDKVAFNYTSENIKNYYLIDDVDKNETLMIIPKDLVLNIESALKFYGTKTNKMYEKYKSEKFEYVNSYLNYRIQQSFLAYLMLSAEKHKSQKNKFYQFYKYFFNTFETSLDSFPMFYNNDQFNLLTSTLAGNEIYQTKLFFEEEYAILNQKIVKNNNLDYDDYFRYRTYTLSKGHNITGLCSLIPFVDIFDVHPTKYNLKLKIDMDDYGVKVVSSRKIKKNRKLMVKIDTVPNSNMLILYGKTFKELENTINMFMVPYVSPLYLQSKNLPESYANNEKIDLATQKFYEDAMPFYMEFSKKIKEDGSTLSALNIFKDNLVAMRNKYDEITTTQIHKTFFTLKDIENIKRIISVEKRFYDEKMKVLDVLIDYTINNKTKDDGLDEEIKKKTKKHKKKDEDADSESDL